VPATPFLGLLWIDRLERHSTETPLPAPIQQSKRRAGPALVAAAEPAPWPAGREVASAVPGANGELQQLPEREGASGVDDDEDFRAPLAWLPPTVAAITLRLLALDAAIVYREDDACARDVLQVRSCVLPASVAMPRAADRPPLRPRGPGHWKGRTFFQRINAWPQKQAARPRRPRVWGNEVRRGLMAGVVAKAVVFSLGSLLHVRSQDGRRFLSLPVAR
jgi:hypothetical protein